MVKTALNSKRKLIYSIKLYTFIIVQVVKFMHEGCHANDLSNLPFFSLCFWQIFKCNIRQRGIYCNHFSVAKLFLVEFFVWIIFLFHMTKGQGFLMEGSGLHDCSLSFFLFLSLSVSGTIYEGQYRSCDNCFII